MRRIFFALFLSLAVLVLPATAEEVPVAAPGPLTMAAKRLTQPRAGTAVKVKGATKFTPTTKPLLLGKITDVLGTDAEKRSALRDILEAGKKAFDTVAAKNGYGNDIAFALTAFVSAQWSVATGKELDDSSSDTLLAQTTVVLSTNEIKNIADVEKQQFYEYCVYMAIFTTTMRDITKDDPKASDGGKAFAGQLLEKMLGVTAARVRISPKGLFLVGTSENNPPKAATDTPGTDLQYTLPAEWQADGMALKRGPRNTGDDTFYGLAILPRVPKQGSMSRTFQNLWKEVVEPRFDTKGHRPFPLPRRFPNGVTLVFDGGYVLAKPGGESRHVFLYVVDAGTDVIPLIGIESFGYSGLQSGEEKNVEAFFNSLRLRGGAPASDKPFFTDRAALVGTWHTGSSSSLDFVSASGAFVGSRVTFVDNKFTLRADGTYDQTLLTMIAGDARRPGKITGRWTFQDGILTMAPEKVTGDVDDKPIRQKVLTVGVAANGKTLLVFDGRLSLLAEERGGLPVYEKQTP
ncbi:MAG: hypothetical protein H8F28_20015 [Fibrella sp.]|nr:hypothetical protein [Armatimonadota bacterium]